MLVLLLPTSEIRLQAVFAKHLLCFFSSVVLDLSLRFLQGHLPVLFLSIALLQMGLARSGGMVAEVVFRGPLCGLDLCNFV